MLKDVIISYGADLARTTRVAIEHARRSGEVTGARWGETQWDVLPTDTVEIGIQRFHQAARIRREQRGREAEEEIDV